MQIIFLRRRDSPRRIVVEAIRRSESLFETSRRWATWDGVYFSKNRRESRVHNEFLSAICNWNAQLEMLVDDSAMTMNTITIMVQ